MIVEYTSTNSGGQWWLTDDDWKNLEKAGWKVEWEKERFLGALARSAKKEFDSIKEAVEEWEKITREDSRAEGCSCCGQPHNFTSEAGS